MTQASQTASGWWVKEDSFSPNDYRKQESLMALSNGYLSLRGSFEEESIKLGHAGTYLNGLYEFHPLQYGEKYTGYPEQSQVMINLPDPKSVNLSINGHTFSLDEGKILEFERYLDIKTASLARHIVWESPSGDQVNIESIRFVSATYKHLACLQYKVTALNFSGAITLTSAIALDRQNLTREQDPRVGVNFEDASWRISETHQHHQLLQVHGSTTLSKLKFRCTLANELGGLKTINTAFEQTAQALCLVGKGQIQAGETLTLTKYMWYDRYEMENPVAQVESIQALGFEALKAEHEAWWAKSWEQMDISIDGAEPMQQAIRFNMFHLTQAVGKDGYTNISAKGMTGEGYEGHYFWDTEIYMIPFFVYTNPHIAKQLLLFRYNTLDKARERALELGHKQGALYPWRTINGYECSAYYPAGTAQYHINADIAYAIRLYYLVTGDKLFMESYGFEMLLELSKLWMDLGVFDPEKAGAFCIQEVTGPDEYTCLVNNNMYTNAMVKSQMAFTLQCFDLGLQLSPSTQALAENFDRALAQRIIERMFLPYSERLKIHAQDDSFLSRPVWDIANTPRNKFPLLMHYHPLTLYRHQVCKQADVVLAELLLSDQFSLEQKKRDFDYYAKITTHDSSLSTCIYGILACELGDMEQSYQYYIKTARTDLDDFHHNAKDGIHAANMAGSWMGIVYGFAGLRWQQDTPVFNPALPPAWTGYRFTVQIHDMSLQVSVQADQVEYALLTGSHLTLKHKDQAFTLTQGQAKVMQ